MTTPLYFNWSTGKDSALALYKLQQNPEFEVGHLLTTVNAHYNRVSMHGLRRELMEAQINAIDIPFSTVELPKAPDMKEYETLMVNELEELKKMGFNDTAFGDIFLEDLRIYREEKLAKMGIKAHFPLWKKDTLELLQEFLELGFKSIVVCASDELLGRSFVGRVIDEAFLGDLPENVDPCGENGEFHTFCFDGPIFKNPVAFDSAEIVLRTYPNPDKNGKKEIGFWYCDLIPKNVEL